MCIPLQCEPSAVVSSQLPADSSRPGAGSCDEPVDHEHHQRHEGRPVVGTLADEGAQMTRTPSTVTRAGPTLLAVLRWCGEPKTLIRMNDHRPHEPTSSQEVQLQKVAACQ